jgi:hypothetical protein
MAGAALGLTPALGCVGSPGARENQMTTDIRFPVQKTDAEWRETLSPEQYKVLREHGTERAFTSPLNNEKRPGTFVCAGCRQRFSVNFGAAPLSPSKVPEAALVDLPTVVGREGANQGWMLTARRP